MRAALPLMLICLVTVALLAGFEIRERIGVVEYSTDSLQAYIATLGLLAPIAFTTLVTFRQFLLLPSSLVLTAGGAVFGTSLGGALGGLGIAVSAMLMFGIARGIAGGWIQNYFGERCHRLNERANAAGPLVVALVTAHPMGVVSPMHWAAGISSMQWKRYLLAVVPASFVRAFAYAYFGSALLDFGTQDFYVATGVLLVIVLLPLLHRGLRQTVLGRARAADRH